MRKRLLSLGLALTFTISLFCGIASVAEARASATLTRYPVILTSGENAGEVDISYDVQANSIADEVGISSILIYKSNGSYETTIFGNTGNGLVRTNAGRHCSTYTYKGFPGNTYYAVVTVFATIGSDSDSRTVTTGTATAPSDP